MGKTPILFLILLLGSYFSGKFQIREDAYCRLKKKDKRNADDKIPVLRFMVKPEHPGERTDAAARDGNQKQCALTDPPAVIPGPAFVCPEQEKSDQVHDDQIDNDYSHLFIYLF